MKSLLLLLTFTSTVLAESLTDFTYTTSNGVGRWNEGAPAPAIAGIGGGQYNSFSFTLNTNSFETPPPSGTGGSLTSVTDAAGTPLTDEQTQQAASSFATGQQVQLTEVSIMGRYNNTNSTVCFIDDLYLTITGSDGSSITSNVATLSLQVWRDPWATSFFYSNYQTAGFTFDEALILTVGTAYTANFTDAAGNILTGNNRPSLTVTTNGDDGFGVSSAGYSPVVVLTSKNFIPEPSTATLSLLALAGLMLRRRRQD